jgi:hypothetical protein
MTRWLHYNLEHPMALAVVLTLLPMTLINADTTTDFYFSELDFT